MTHPADTVVPFPPRYWWLRRLSVVAVAGVLVLVAGRAGWGIHAQRTLDRQLDVLRAAGVPVVVDDLTPAPLDESENLAEYLNRAAAARNTTVESPRNSNLNYQNYPPFPAEWWAAAKGSYEANGPALAIARQARKFDRAVWQRQYASPLPAGMFPGFNGQRALASMLADAALYQHMIGNDHESLELSLDLLHQAHALDQQPFLIGHLVAIGIRGLALANVAAIAPGLSMNDADREIAGTIKRADRKQIEALIALMLDESTEKNVSEWTMQTEQLGFVDGATWAARTALLLRPMIQLDIAQDFQAAAQRTAAARAATWPVAKARLPKAPGVNAGPSMVTSAMRAILSPSMERALLTDFRIRLESRLTAVSLAAQLFRIDRGRWPNDLAEMVPDYLPKIPSDTFDPAGGPVRYLLADGGKRPIVYSADDDGVDQTTAGTRLPVRPCIGWIYFRNSWPTRDQYRDISRFKVDPKAAADDDLLSR